MFYMSEKKFRSEMRKIRLKNESKLRKQELRNEKNKYKEKKKIQTSKVFFVLLFLSCSSTQLFSMTAMWHYANLDSLSTLIGATLTEGIGLMAYYCKAYLESKEEEKLKFEREKFYTENQTCTYEENSSDNEPVG